MSNKWILIRRLYLNRWDANGFIEVMSDKFPNIKFKLGITRVEPDPNNYREYPAVTTAVMALLPSPHPNETAREVFEYAQKIDSDITWKAKNAQGS